MKKSLGTPLSRIKRLFLVETALYIKCLDELKKQQVIDEKVYDQKLIDDTISFDCFGIFLTKSFFINRALHLVTIFFFFVILKAKITLSLSTI